MNMKLLNVHDPIFAQYGQVLEGYELTGFLEKLARRP
jgi:hypothetical protein